MGRPLTPLSVTAEDELSCLSGARGLRPHRRWPCALALSCWLPRARATPPSHGSYL